MQTAIAPLHCSLHKVNGVGVVVVEAVLVLSIVDIEVAVDMVVVGIEVEDGPSPLLSVVKVVKRATVEVVCAFEEVP